AHVQSCLRRDEGSVQPRLGGTRLALRNAARAGARGRQDSGRSGAGEASGGTREVRLMLAQARSPLRILSRYIAPMLVSRCDVRERYPNAIAGGDICYDVLKKVVSRITQPIASMLQAVVSSRNSLPSW